MADGDIPRDVQDFVLQHLDSIAHLEALLLLRANPGERWDLAKLAARLYTGEREAEAVLARLSGDRFIQVENGLHHYDPQPPERRELVDRLAAIYAKQLIPVTNLIHDKQRRIREFADAFRFRRNP